MVTGTADQQQTLEGKWKIDADRLTFAIERISSQKKGEVSHSRDADVRLHYQIRSLGEKEMVLYDVRRKKEIRLAR